MSNKLKIIKNIDLLNIDDIAIESLDTYIDIIGTIFPPIYPLLKSLYLPIKLGYNIKNKKELNDKLKIIIDNIKSIFKNLKNQELNFKAHIFASELYTQIFFMDDI